MLPRNLVLRNPSLRSLFLSSLYRYLLKSIGCYPDRIVKVNLELLVKTQFRGNKSEYSYQKYSPQIKQAELLASYLKAVEGSTDSERL